MTMRHEKRSRFTDVRKQINTDINWYTNKRTLRLRHTQHRNKELNKAFKKTRKKTWKITAK